MIETIRRLKTHSIAVFLALAITGCANGARQTSVVPYVSSEPAAQRVARHFAEAGSSYRVLLRFNGSDGASPNGGLLFVNGQIIGTTRAGGTYHCRCGTVFKLTPKRRGYTERILHEFAAGKDGAYPLYGPIASAGGSLLGTTSSGGGNNSCGNSYYSLSKPCGTVFELKPDGTRYSERVLSTMGTGWSPQGLLEVKGTLYTVTEYGANDNGACGYVEYNYPTGCGAVISLTPGRNQYAQHLLFAFPTAQDSYYPIGTLIADATGTLYGVTTVGGVTPSNCNPYGGGSSSYGGCGSVFSLQKNGTLKTLHAFAGGSDGGVPAGGLTAGPNGVFYGATVQGGGGSCAYTSIGIGCGVVYELTPSRAGYVESVLYAFKGGNDGAVPSGALIMDASNALYGTTAQGGGNGCHNRGCGTVFKLTQNGAGCTETILHAFKGGSDGKTPTGSLTMGKNGRLFGTTSAGGETKVCLGGCGTVFAL